MHRRKQSAFQAICVLVALLLSACASDSRQSNHIAECDISSLQPNDYPHDTWCLIKHAAMRCSTKSDKCLTQCERRGGANNIGGGCAHICFNGLYTEDRIAENGGEAWPPEAVSCANEDAP